LQARDEKAQQKLPAELREISDRSAAAFRKSGKTRSARELIDELYDENGLPRRLQFSLGNRKHDSTIACWCATRSAECRP
jgi:hypothetical protein